MNFSLIDAYFALADMAVALGVVKAPRRIPSTGINPDGRQMRRYERQLTAAVAAIFEKMQRSLFRGVNRANIWEVNNRLNSREYWEPLRMVLTNHLQRIGEGGADLGREQVESEIFGVSKRVDLAAAININWELANNAAGDWAIEYGRTLTGQLAKTTTPRIQKLISEFVNSPDMTINQLTSLIQDGYLYSPERARAIAVTEVTRAFAQGNLAAWRESEVVERKRWNTAVDELVCPICRPLAGQIEDIGGTFDGGLDGPPAHVRCRCWVTPVVDVSS